MTIHVVGETISLPQGDADVAIAELTGSLAQAVDTGRLLLSRRSFRLPPPSRAKYWRLPAIATPRSLAMRVRSDLPQWPRPKAGPTLAP
jgi:hypothetical protein